VVILQRLRLCGSVQVRRGAELNETWLSRRLCSV